MYLKGYVEITLYRGVFFRVQESAGERVIQKQQKQQFLSGRNVFQKGVSTPPSLLSGSHPLPQRARVKPIIDSTPDKVSEGLAAA